jgi:hypothetical protein
MNVTFEFPDTIHINIINAETRLPVQNIALLIHLLALRNMDHFLFSPVSDNQGIVNISKGWLIEQIDTNDVYLTVDRISGIDDLYPAIEVMTATEHDINKSIELLSNNQSHEENIAQIEELSHSVNHLYSQSKISLELNNEPEIWVTLEITKTKLIP